MKEKDEEFGKEFKFKNYPTVCWLLFLVLMSKMMNQWARKFLSYSFGYSVGDGIPLANKEFFEISSFYP